MVYGACVARTSEFPGRLHNFFTKMTILEQMCGTKGIQYLVSVKKSVLWCLAAFLCLAITSPLSTSLVLGCCIQTAVLHWATVWGSFIAICID